MDTTNTQKFRQLLDLQNPMKEVSDKLMNTYIELNKEIVLLADIITIGGKQDILLVYKINSPDESVLVEKIESLNFFLPEAGNYPIPCGGFINVQKKPNRQYARSFKLENYSISSYSDDTFTYKNGVLPHLPLLIPENRETISVWGNDIYYLTTVIGFFTEKKDIMCTNEFFEQELLEWSKWHYGNI